MNKIDFTLNIDGEGEPRILMLSDIQIIQSEQQRFETRLNKGEFDRWVTSNDEHNWKFCVRETVQSFKPDFIFTAGDNVYGEFDDSGRAQLDFVQFMDSFGIPWAPIFGNHDNDSVLGADWQCEQYVNAPNCLFKQGNLSGNCNYTVGIRRGGKLIRVFFMTDSNACFGMSPKTEANGHTPKIIGLAQDQIEWVKNTSEEIKKDCPDAGLSIVFHVQLNAFASAMAELGLSEKTGYNFDTDCDNKENFGYFGRQYGGWDADESFFNMIKEHGFDSVFVGHEHENSFSVMYKGVRLTYGQKSSAYDKINYITDDPDHYSPSYSRIGYPVWGGTGMTLGDDGHFTEMKLVKVRNSYENDASDN